MQERKIFLNNQLQIRSLRRKKSDSEYLKHNQQCVCVYKIHTHTDTYMKRETKQGREVRLDGVGGRGVEKMQATVIEQQ